MKKLSSPFYSFLSLEWQKGMHPYTRRDVIESLDDMRGKPKRWSVTRLRALQNKLWSQSYFYSWYFEGV